MSEYQYYEFQAVDRPLSTKQMGELRRISTRAEISPHRFVNVYHFGDFKGDPVKLMAGYYDAFLYLANWGTRWLMLRVPKKLLDPGVAVAYVAADCLSVHEQRSELILSLRARDDEDYEWAEGTGWLGSIVPLRAELLRGDLRILYLGWLLGVQLEEVDEDALEPPVPPGLGALDGSLARAAEFLRIDTDLIAAAAEQSAGRQDAPLSNKELDRWIGKLPANKRDALLAELITSDDPHLVPELRQRALREVRGAPPLSGLRSLSSLVPGCRSPTTLRSPTCGISATWLKCRAMTRGSFRCGWRRFRPSTAGRRRSWIGSRRRFWGESGHDGHDSWSDSWPDL